MIKAEILPKTPRELRLDFQMMRRVLKLVYIDSQNESDVIFSSKFNVHINL